VTAVQQWWYGQGKRGGGGFRGILVPRNDFFFYKTSNAAGNDQSIGSNVNYDTSSMTYAAGVFGSNQPHPYKPFWYINTHAGWPDLNDVLWVRKTVPRSLGPGPWRVTCVYDNGFELWVNGVNVTASCVSVDGFEFYYDFTPRGGDNVIALKVTEAQAANVGTNYGLAGIEIRNDV
jgi:hypothetical protein